MVFLWSRITAGTELSYCGVGFLIPNVEIKYLLSMHWSHRMGVEVYLHPFFNFGFKGSVLSTLRHGILARGKGLRYPLIRSFDFFVVWRNKLLSFNYDFLMAGWWN